ncbi:MAG: hypothetical protein DWQ10_11640 [Calditrichaeota bacterium]|nr:MAG: hypothetical protein DWQ10_11640 [Calditrichota bacterium]
MKRKFCCVFYLLLILFLMVSSCKDSGTKPPDYPVEWTFLGLEGMLIDKLVLSKGKLYACAGREGLFRLNNPSGNDTQWEYLGLADARIGDHRGVSDVVTLNDTLLVSHYASSDHYNKAGISRSRDNGKTWTAIDSGFIKNTQYPTSAFLLTLDQSPFNSDIVIAGCVSDCSDIYLSKDFGLSWETKDILPLKANVRFDIARFHPTNENEIWAGMNIEYDTVRPFLYRSVDFGENWQTIIERPYDPDAPSEYLEDIAFSSEENSTIYVAIQQTIIKSIDFGTTWTTSFDTLDSGIFWNITNHPNDRNQLIACSTDSLYQTVDAGKTWTALVAKPENTEMMKDLVVDWSNKMLYVNTYNPSNGIYRLHYK